MRLENHLLAGVGPQHLLRCVLEVVDGAHHAGVEGEPKVADEGERNGGADPRDVAAVRVGGDARPHQLVQLRGGAGPEVEAHLQRTRHRLRQGFGGDVERLRVDQAGLEAVEGGPAVLDELVVALLQTWPGCLRGVIVEGLRRPLTGFLQVRLDPAQQHQVLGPFLRRHRLREREALSVDAGLHEQPLAFDELQKDRVHEVVGIEVRVEDQVGQVADVAVKDPDFLEEIREQLVGVVPRGVEGFLLQEAPVVLERIELGRRIHRGAELAVDRFHRRDVQVDLGELPDDFGPARPVAARVNPSQAPGFAGVAVEGDERPEVAGALDFLGRELDALPELDQHEVHHQPQGREEEHADQEELARVGQPVHQADGRHQDGVLSPRFPLYGLRRVQGASGWRSAERSRREWVWRRSRRSRP